MSSPWTRSSAFRRFKLRSGDHVVVYVQGVNSSWHVTVTSGECGAAGPLVGRICSTVYKSEMGARRAIEKALASELEEE